MMRRTRSPRSDHDGRADGRRGGRQHQRLEERTWTSSPKDFSNFYSIGYRATRSAVDRPHSVEVKVKRKGLTVRSRKGFLERDDRDPDRGVGHGEPPHPRDDNPLGDQRVGRGAGALRPGQLRPLPVRIAVPIGKLGLVPGRRSLRGRRSSSTSWPGTPRRSSRTWRSSARWSRSRPRDLDRAQHKDWYYDFTMTVSPGAQRISFAVRDAISNLVSYYQKSLFVSLLPQGDQGRRVDED